MSQGGGCTFGSEVEGTGAVAPAGQAVGTGTTDTSNSYNFVDPGQTAPYCTGVLLTPVWVALANHCITGSDSGILACAGLGTPTYEPSTGIGTSGALEVTFDYNPMAIGTNLFTPQSLTPRFAAVPPHAVRMTSPVNWCLDSQRKKDLALVKLSARVPSSIAVPKHPPGVLGTPECPGGGEEFYGQLVGYGHKTLWFGSEDQNRKRNYASAVEYEYDDQLYKNTWMVPPWALFDPSWYTGGLGGDSGAPLFEVSSGQVCGLHVAHKVFFDIEWIGGFFPVVLLVAESNAVALDFDDNQSFVKARVVDSRGQFMGECGTTGDPTAPTALLDLDADGDYLPDACDPCPEVPDNQYRATGVLSAQMTPMGPNDADKDGIPDLCDLCPQHGKALGDGRQLIGGVWRQPDADGDGLANACDSDCPANANVSDLTCCNPSNPGTTCDPAGSLLPWSNRCFAIAPQTAAMASIACPTFGRCGKPLDSDQDGTPETCDNCPGESNGKQDDTDGDGVGDACDNCPGKHAFGPQLADAAHPSCVPGDPVDGDPACAALAPGGRCAFVPPNGGRCTKQADADGDGRGDGCDSCRLVQNPLQKNCNLEIERTLNEPYPFIGDACDRTPCARLFESAKYIESKYGTGNLWAATSYNPVLLPEGKVGPLPENTAFTYGAKPLADVGGRHCDCSPMKGLSGKKLPTAWDCRGVCPLNSDRYNPAQGNPWFPTSLSTTGTLPLPLPPLPALLTNLGMQRPFELTGEPPVAELPDDAPTYFSWSLTADGAKSFAGLFGTPAWGLLDVYWSHVEGVPQLDAAQPACVQGVPACFRPRSNAYKAGFFGVVAGKSVFEAPAVLFNSCFWCALEPCPQCGFWKEVGNLVVQPASAAQPAKVVLSSTDHDNELTAAFAPSLIPELVDPSVRWVTAAEREHWPAGGAVLAAVASDGTAVTAVASVHDGIVSASERRAGLAEDTTRDRVHPAARQSFGAVLSATEKALFLFGGTLWPGVAPPDAAVLWSYDLETKSWRAAALNGAIPGKVLAATLRVEDRSLYVVDEVTRGGQRVARLLRISLSDLRSSVVALFPRSPRLTRVDLVAAPDGRLLLASSFVGPDRHRVALIVPNPGRPTRVLWTLAGSGQLAAEPNLTANGLTLPLRAPDANPPVANRFVATPALPAAPAFGLEACL